MMRHQQNHLVMWTRMLQRNLNLTEVDRETSRARVVFKRSADAEVAHSSAAKFNIFGSMIVNFRKEQAPEDKMGSVPVTYVWLSNTSFVQSYLAIHLLWLV
ncbi:hypothetical protein LWI29_027152 [Acer saccharum]|uniref:Uncharacterized protein n=1 Tax=Acer saccharum TaxID=4024 RepID=A0AA39SHC0_ACESA|nr:hypothetical protein LWI29_027152 [Acer saccharum]